ncbi:AMP-binding protein [Agromyces sp. NPDC049794]|uniref:AMP-binding protein n=1 Tax=unclassified Agromyces TaxID=2639701 RepID=UPI0033E7AA0A
MNPAGANLFSQLFPATGDDAVAAVISPDGERIEYDDLSRLAGCYANALVAAGLRPGDRLMAITDKSVAAIVLYLATLRAGGIYVPVNTAYTRAELEYFVHDARPAIVVGDPTREAELVALCARQETRLLTMDSAGNGTLQLAARDLPSDHAVVPVEPDDVAAILYTSGTTGRAKGAMLSHGNLLANARALRSAWAFSADDVLVHALPIFHTHGLFVGLNVSFLSRASIILLRRFDPHVVAAQLPRATVLMGVPTYYSRLLAVPELPGLCRRVRLFISGSAPLLPATHGAWRARTGHDIVERYGMTETTMITSNPLDGPRKPGTVGRPLPGVTVRISDADAHGIGMIQVAGPNVFRGYWQMPEKTAAEFTADGFFITGDLGRIDDDGYLHIVGREKDVIITGGYNVYPKEVESVIDAFDGVAETAVFGLPDQDLGERVIAAIVPDGGAVIERAALERYLADRLARYKRPREVVFVSELPRNVMGKVQKSVLRGDPRVGLAATPNEPASSTPHPELTRKKQTT